VFYEPNRASALANFYPEVIWETPALQYDLIQKVAVEQLLLALRDQENL